MSIYKNDFGGNVIQFGIGDIEVNNDRTLTDDAKKSIPNVTLTQREKGQIGAFCNPDAKDEPAESRGDVHTILAFTDIRSFDVVIDHLKQAKERFRLNGLKILNPPGNNRRNRGC